MTYALIADIHGNLPALRAVLSDARQQGADKILFLGDNAMGLGAPRETLALMRAQPMAQGVYGNEDESLLRLRGKSAPPGEAQFETVYWTAQDLPAEEIAYLAALPQSLEIREPGLPLVRAFHMPELLFDGLPPAMLTPMFFEEGIVQARFTPSDFPDAVQRWMSEDAPLRSRLAQLPPGVYAMGHRHVQWDVRLGDHLLVAPGSCGLALDFQPDAAYTLLQGQAGDWQVHRRRVAYDLSEALQGLWASPYGQAVRVWRDIIAHELVTARGQAMPFLHFIESYAQERGDSRRPYHRDTWEGAFEAWWALQPDRGHPLYQGR